MIQSAPWQEQMGEVLLPVSEKQVNNGSLKDMQLALNHFDVRYSFRRDHVMQSDILTIHQDDLPKLREAMHIDTGQDMQQAAEIMTSNRDMTSMIRDREWCQDLGEVMTPISSEELESETLMSALETLGVDYHIRYHENMRCNVLVANRLEGNDQTLISILGGIDNLRDVTDNTPVTEKLHWEPV